jgi:prevent-host-death family protein
MRIVNIHEAKTHLSRLVEEAANGESFVIAKAGKPLVKVVEGVTLLTTDSIIAQYPAPVRQV